MAKQKNKQEWKPFLSFLKHAKLPWGLYILDVVASLIFSTVYMAMPQVAGQIMAGEIFDPQLVTTYVAVTIGSAVLSMPFSIFAAYISYKAQRNMRRTIWQRLIHLPMKEIDKMPPTSLVSRVTTDTDMVDYAISYVFTMINVVYSLVMMLGIVFGMSPKMCGMMALLIPCIIIASIPSHFMHKANYEIKTANAKYTNFLAEHLSALKQIKASAAEKKEDAANDAAAKACYKANVKQAVLDMLAQPLGYGMEAVVQGIILIYGGYLMSRMN